MIIWLNGAFGSGKTQTANELCRRLNKAYLYDPENVGYWLRKNEPAELAADNFQDEPLWRSVNRDMLFHLAEQYQGIIVVPMTLVDVRYYHEIIGALRANGIEVQHFILCVREKTLRKRLHKRLEFGNSWAVRQIPRCFTAFESPVFENKLQTDGKSIPEVAEEIANRLSLTLQPRSNPILQIWKQLRTQLRAVKK
ncbi:MAG TPA: AAA family ATPase [Candidatus Avimonoglobus intestinipullorum]|uniref:AAA family ATPase n=1 Tax=Candidatus Avimonoglobus intestinipullorum TaxID=2840699 RepID=A0A9D1S6B8_9FIRM|nr:AAA family ATPase [Candidatus Avimonoglobus intestinipullorum]